MSILRGEDGSVVTECARRKAYLKFGKGEAAKKCCKWEEMGERS